MFCPGCGKELDESNICVNPACPLDSESNQGNSFTDRTGISPGEMMNFFGPKNTEYYMDKWDIEQKKPIFISWNWPAFLFNWLWIFFRKMPIIASIFLVVLTIAKIMLPRSIYVLIYLISMVLCGLFANQAYIKHAIDRIRAIKVTTGMNPQILPRRLKANGGTTWVPVIVFLVICTIIVLLIIFFIVSLGSILGAGSESIFKFLADLH